MMNNPFSPPIPDESPRPDVPSVEPPSSETLASIAKPTFLAWERLRVIYVILLGILTLLLAGPHLVEMRTLILIAEGAIFANVCFFAGPIIETYVRWLGYERKWVRWALFVGGTLLTALLAVVTMVSMFIAAQV